LAIRWPQGIKNPGRKVTDYVSFVDFAPTFLEVAGINWPAQELDPSSGHSLTDIFRSGQDGQSNVARDHVLIGRERNDLGRPGGPHGLWLLIPAAASLRDRIRDLSGAELANELLPIPEAETNCLPCRSP
jgi:hypothetical protein